MSLRAIPLALLALVSAADDAIDSIRADRDDERARAKAVFESAIAKADEKTVKALENAASGAQRRGDLPEAMRAWKEVLRFDPQHAQATQFFTATNSLESVLAEVAQRRQVPVPGSAPMVMPRNATTVSIDAASSGADLGRQRAGTTLLVQYVDGAWSSWRTAAVASPDAGVSARDLRLAIVDLTTGSPQILVVVPAGTADKPFAYTLTTDVGKLALAISAGPRPRRSTTDSNGRARYRLAIIKP